MRTPYYQLSLGTSDFFKFTSKEIETYFTEHQGVDITFKDYPETNGVLPFGVRLQKSLSLVGEYNKQKPQMFRVAVLMPQEDGTQRLSQRPLEEVIMPALDIINEDFKGRTEIKETLWPHLLVRRGAFMGPYTMKQTHSLVRMLHDLSLMSHMIKTKFYQGGDLMNFDMEMLQFIDDMKQEHLQPSSPASGPY